MQSVLNGMRSGKSFSVYGDLINALDYRVRHGNKQAEMGSNLQVKKGNPMKLRSDSKSE